MLSVSNLYVYYGESRILNDVSIEIPKGKVVCLMGRNGVGKTTLLKTIMGNLKSRKGTITYEGKDITREPAHKRARMGLGYVPQGRGIFPFLSVYENLLMGLEALTSTELKHADQKIEEVYEIFPVLKQMGKRVAGTLSGGQQQQLAFGRILVRSPKLLLLDEPTEGIQPNIVDEIEHLVSSLGKKGDISILLIEQFLDFALRVADYCYVMEKGHIVSQGNTNDLSQDIIREHLSV
ncbi:MAG: urea ABC transporter ATP-binding subunit UrtE [Anaerolineaceae bacterium]|nr:urea ABC transporter ATP-binding subunit UrtE [Anaerolineaceae bacterium]